MSNPLILILNRGGIIMIREIYYPLDDFSSKDKLIISGVWVEKLGSIVEDIRCLSIMINLYRLAKNYASAGVWFYRISEEV